MISMSKRCGMPWMKLDSKSYTPGSKKAEHHGNNKAVMCEALKERWSKDADLDRRKTRYNIYYGYESGLELLNDINHEIADLSEELRKNGKRGIRKDAITSFTGIIKPDKEVMQNLTPKQQVKFFEDALELLVDRFGTNPNTGKTNIRAMVIQVDEGNIHAHYFGVPYTHDGRLCADDIFTPKLSRWLNEEFPKLMNEKGWDLERCRDDNAYQPDIAKSLNDDELKEYKEKCLEYKKNKQKRHGKTSDEYKKQKEIDKAVEAEKQRLKQKEKSIAEKENAVLKAQKAVLTSQTEMDNKALELDEKVARIDNMKAMATECLMRAASIEKNLEKESTEFEKYKAKPYKQSIANVGKLNVKLDESLVPIRQRSRQKERSL